MTILLATDVDVQQVLKDYPEDSVEWKVAEQVRRDRQFSSDDATLTKEEVNELVSHIRTQAGLDFIHQLKCRNVIK